MRVQDIKHWTILSLLFFSTFFMVTVLLTCFSFSEVDRDLMYIRRGKDFDTFQKRIQAVATRANTRQKTVIQSLYRAEWKRRIALIVYSHWMDRFLNSIPYDTTNYKKSNRRLLRAIDKIMLAKTGPPEILQWRLLNAIKDHPEAHLRQLFVLIKSE